ncbi:anthranilate phosphoribosyltransferase [Candidatus Sumerlaeota bacterium]|nr:anthranilate phosphoribosyltransferase [Candidatus Sumerlaeota bacterium]
MIREAISKLVSGEESLSEQESRAVAEEIMSGEATPAQIASFITALRMRGETVDNIVGFVRVMREKATPIKAPQGVPILDTCGTGGDGAGSFNISTTSALVCAAAGVKVAKHGNRGVSSSCGSADVLEALGVKIDVPPEVSEKCLDELNFCFLFAPLYHKAMKFAIGPRREIGIRTIFNLIGPLSNPAGATCQLIGVFNPDLLELFARTLKDLGTQRALIVHGSAGLDEISLVSATTICELGADGRIETYPVDPGDFEMECCEISDLAGGTARENAEIIQDILSGTEGPRANALLLNAGAALYVSGCADSVLEGIHLARDVIQSRAPIQLLENLKEMTGAAQKA